jgi:hypothetical protein
MTTYAEKKSCSVNGKINFPRRLELFRNQSSPVERPKMSDVNSFADLHWFEIECGSVSSFLSQCGSGSGSKELETDQDPDHGQILKSQEVKFLHEKYTKEGNRSKNIPTKVQKPF